MLLKVTLIIAPEGSSIQGTYSLLPEGVRREWQIMLSAWTSGLEDKM